MLGTAVKLEIVVLVVTQAAAAQKSAVKPRKAEVLMVIQVEYDSAAQISKPILLMEYQA